MAVERLEDRSLLAAYGSIDDIVVDSDSYAEDQIVVQFDTGSESGFVAPNELPLPGLKLGDSLGADGLYEVYLDGNTTPEQAVAAFEASPNVSFAHPDFDVQLTAIPNDPAFSSLWGLNNTGQSNGVEDADIDAVEAWDIRTDASSVVVAVIDTGIDYTHPDLVDNMWVNAGEIAGDGVDNDGNGYVDDIYGYDFINNDADPMDDHYHGTHVAGTIGAQGDNGVGVTGVAWDVQLMALKFLGANGSGSSSGAIAAINYAANNGADIANNSWGGGGFNTSLQNAINNFVDNGGIFTAAAGNHGGNNDEGGFYPANYNNVISVAASTRNDTKAGFSGYGVNTVDIAAPGASILSTTPNNNYRYLSGTSMATPIVSGAFAILAAEFPEDTNQELIDRMMEAADPVLTQYTTYGRLNLDAAIGDGDDDEPPADTTGPKVNSAVWDDNVDAVVVTFSEAIDVTTFTTADVDLTGPNGSIAIDSVNEVGVDGTTFEITFAAQNDVGGYSMDIGPDISDVAGNTMDQDMDGSQGETPDDVFMTTYEIEGNAVFEWSGDVALRDATRRRWRTRYGRTVVRFDIGEDITIGDLDVQLTLNHTWDSDLAIYLVGPGGNSLLFNRRGGSGDNVFATFDDEASTAIADGAAPFDGSYRPDSSLSVFDGESTQGSWAVYIYDLARGDTGNITNIKLFVTPENGGDATGFDSGASSDALGSADIAYQAPPVEEDSVFDTVAITPRQLVSASVAEPIAEQTESSDWRDGLTDSEPSSVDIVDSDLVFATAASEGDLELFD
ncbi:MAG: S8 family serine peptidase [Planctomycetaceae bacterium]